MNVNGSNFPSNRQTSLRQDSVKSLGQIMPQVLDRIRQRIALRESEQAASGSASWVQGLLPFAEPREFVAAIQSKAKSTNETLVTGLLLAAS